jgi:NADH:ubiquinone oxidoreductase subunit 5 (subunit L)/multisubunit Na+/H+ antiporter MnhA subunit
MHPFLSLFLWFPLLTFLASMLVPKKKEKIISRLTILSIGIYLAGIVLFIVGWFLNNQPTLDVKYFVLFRKDDIEIFIDFYFDRITAVFAFMGGLLTLLVSIFSRYYLHREEGFKRFFNSLLLFFLGYNFIIFSGNFETLFVGWEILGICSFLLIAFYRDRYLPVKNALKTISIYRLGDVCLILAMWMSHHLWHENITFLKLNDLKLVEEHLREHNWYGFFIALMILLAAAVKSAQLPFSSWLPRAMEGPTTSSAIFYGSLSVHIGLFLLMRTYPYWESLYSIKGMIILVGLLTSIIATNIARVQSTVKTQIAYSSIAQIGLMFIEVALGFHTMALIHFAGNAFLRTYQLLVSPSVLNYLVHDMFFNYTPLSAKNKSGGFSKIINSLYILNIKEWNLDYFLYRFLWSPFKWAGKRLNFINNRVIAFFLGPLYLFGLFVSEFREKFSIEIIDWLPFFYSFAGLLLILKSFSERTDASRTWIHIFSGQLFITLSVTLLNENFGYQDILLLLSGSISAAVVGYFCLKKIKNIDNDIDLNRYHGYQYEQPTVAFIFLLCCLGIIGVPFTPTFIGIDLLFSHIHKHQELLIIFTAISFLFIEIAVLRIYARIFLGPHKKAYHPIAFRSS